MTNKERKKAIDALRVSVPIYTMTREKFNDYIQTLNKVMDWLEQEPCEDCISRKAVLEAFGLSEKSRKYGGDHSGYDTLMKYEIQDILEDLPPVTPQPKIGRWILKRTFPTKLYDEYLREYECSECHRAIRCTESQLINYPYSRCGAKMQEVEE